MNAMDNHAGGGFNKSIHQAFLCLLGAEEEEYLASVWPLVQVSVFSGFWNCSRV